MASTQAPIHRRTNNYERKAHYKAISTESTENTENTENAKTRKHENAKTRKPGAKAIASAKPPIQGWDGHDQRKIPIQGRIGNCQRRASATQLVDLIKKYFDHSRDDRWI
jgi:hypothetical protein